MISFPLQMTSWPVPGQFDGTTGATPLGILKTEGVGAIAKLKTADLALGYVGGSLGEISALALLIGAAYLFYKNTSPGRFPLVLLERCLSLRLFFTGLIRSSTPARCFTCSVAACS